MLHPLRTLVIAALVLLPLAAFGIIMVVLFGEEQRRSVEALLQQTASSAVTAIEHRLADDVAVLETLATAHALDDGDFARFYDQAQRALRNRPHWTNIVLTDREQQLLNTRLPFGAELPVLLDRGGATRVFDTGERHVSGVFRETTRIPEPFLQVRVPVVRDGKTRYTLSAVVKAFSLHRLLRAQTVLEGSRIGVIDQNRRFLARTDTLEAKDDAIGGLPSDPVLASLSGPEKALSRQTTRANEDFLFIHADLPAIGWAVLVAAPPDLIEAPLRRSLFSAAAGGAAALLLTAGLAAWATRATSQRLKAESRLTVLEAEKALEQRFADVADHFPGGIFRRVQRPDGRIEFPYVSGMKGVVEVEDQGPLTVEALKSMLVPEDRQRWCDALATSRRAMTPLQFEGQLHDRCGNLRWFRASANIRRFADGSTVWDGVIFDITDLKHAGRALLTSRDEAQAARRAAERADAAKSKFLASASHDLRQPVQSLFFLLAALEDKVSGETATTTLAYAQEALAALRGLLDGLMDVSRLDAGLVVPQVATVSLGPLLDQIAAESRPLAESKGLAWRLGYEGGAVRSDPVLLGRLIRNLVQNAVRYTEHGTVAIEGRRDGDRVTLTVRDTGIGIPGDRLDDIFGEFVQIGNPERDRSQGLGLGLAIVRRIARLLGHAVEVRSESGRGSAFTVTLPVAPEAASVLTAETAVTETCTKTQVGPQGDLIVVIDDDALVRRGVTALLERWGCRVMAAGCLRDALDRLDSDARPAAVLADYRLGSRETGIDVLLTLRTRLDADFVAVLLTGDTAPECRGLAERHGIMVMHKPVAPDDLRDLICPQSRKAAPEPALVS